MISFVYLHALLKVLRYVEALSTQISTYVLNASYCLYFK